MNQPPPPPPSEDHVVAALTRATVMFSGALVVVLLVTVFFLFPQWQLGARGVILGAVLGLLSWVMPSWMISNQLKGAARRGPDPARVPAIVATAAYVGISFAELPALLALVSIFLLGGTDIAAVVVAVPVAVASLWLVVSGPAAVRRHLARLRG